MIVGVAGVTVSDSRVRTEATLRNTGLGDSRRPTKIYIQYQ